MYNYWKSIFAILVAMTSSVIARAAIDLFPIPDVISCAYYVLPPIAGNELSGNEAYFSGPAGSGSSYEPGDTIFNSSIIYAYDQMGIESDEECFYLQVINNLADLSMLENDSGCQYYVLPYFTTPSVSGFAGYYTAAQASGIRYQQGDTLFHSESLFAFDGYDNCFIEKEIHIIVDTLPIFDSIPDQYGCNSYELVPFPGDHVITDEVFFRQGTQLFNTGDIINASQTITISIQKGVCLAEKEFEIIIVDHLELDEKQDTFICGPSFFLPPIGGAIMSSFARYYRLPGGEGISYEPGDNHSSINYPVLYIYDSIPGSTCVDETEWNIHYTPRPQAFSDFTVTVCRGYSYPIETLLLRRNIPKYTNRIIPAETNPLLPSEVIFHTTSYPPGEYLFYVIDTTGFPCIPDTSIMKVISTEDCTNSDFAETYCTDQHPFPFYLSVNLVTDTALCLGGQLVDIAGNPFHQWNEHVILDRSTPDTLTYFYILTDPFGNTDTAVITIRLQDYALMKNELIGPDTLCKGECTGVRIAFLDDDPYIPVWETKSEEDLSVFHNLTYNENFTRNDTLKICFLNGNRNITVENQDTIFLPAANHTYTNSIWLISNLKECHFEDDTIFRITTLDETTFYFQETYCAGTEVDLFGESFSETRPEGEIKLDIPAVNGCDSFIYVNLSFYTPAIALYNQEVCHDDTIVINCIQYTHAFPRDTQYLPGLGHFGCDSVIIINLDFSSLEEVFIDTTICEGDVFSFAGLTLDTPGITTGVLQSLNLCDSLLYTIELSITPLPILEIEIEKPLCNGDAGSLSIQDHFEEILWSTQESTPQIDVLQPGIYSVTVTDESNCTQTSSIEVTPSDDFYISGDHHYTTAPGQPILFALTTIGVLDSIFWVQSEGLDCSNCLNPEAILFSSQSFDYIAIDLNGCEVMGTVEVTIKEEEFQYIPNIFYPLSPIPDNRVFSVFTGPRSKAYAMTIYDRWGNMVFHHNDLQTNDTSGGWNGRFKGTLVQSGVYAYRVFIDESTTPITGTITVIY